MVGRLVDLFGLVGHVGMWLVGWSGGRGDGYQGGSSYYIPVGLAGRQAGCRWILVGWSTTRNTRIDQPVAVGDHASDQRQGMATISRRDLSRRYARGSRRHSLCAPRPASPPFPEAWRLSNARRRGSVCQQSGIPAGRADAFPVELELRASEAPELVGPEVVEPTVVLGDFSDADASAAVGFFSRMMLLLTSQHCLDVTP
jgi:hypothetical protein